MKLLLVDDHQLLLDGLALLIADSFPEVELFSAGSLSEALRVLAHHPDVRLVLLDLGLPDASGLSALAALRRHGENATIVVLSGDAEPRTITAAIDAGAAGYVVKSTASAEMIAALRKVLGGGIHVPTNVALAAPAPAIQAMLGLSERQREVLQLLVQGKSNKVICRELGLSESTVKTHLVAIFDRLGVHSRTQAVIAAARLGWRISP